MMVSYQTLFSAHCTSCQRVLSGEGYIPPVARLWRLDSEQQDVAPSQARNAVGVGSTAANSSVTPAGGDSIVGTNGENTGDNGAGGGATDGRRDISSDSGKWEARHVTCLK